MEFEVASFPLGEGFYLDTVNERVLTVAEILTFALCEGLAHVLCGEIYSSWVNL